MVGSMSVCRHLESFLSVHSKARRDVTMRRTTSDEQEEQRVGRVTKEEEEMDGTGGGLL